MNEIKTQDAIDLLKRCQQDPLFFSRYVLGGEQPWDKQKEIMLSVRDNPRTVLPSGFSVGKLEDFMNSIKNNRVLSRIVRFFIAE